MFKCREILQIVFKSIIVNVKEYINFLPDSLRYASEENELQITSSAKEEGSDIASQSSSIHSSNSSAASGYGEESLNKQKKKINFGLTKKENVVLLKVIASNKIDEKDEKNGIEAFGKKFIQFNDVVCDCVYSKRGTISQMLDFEILATFNSERTLMTPSLNAVDCARMIEEKLLLIGMKCVILVIKVDDAVCGTLKSKYNSKFQLFSPKLKLLNCLEQKNQFALHSNIDFSKTGNIFVNSLIQKETKYEFLMKQVNAIDYFDYMQKEKKEKKDTNEIKEMKETNEEKEVFFRVVQKKNTDSKVNSEWMYKIAKDLEQEKTNDEKNTDVDEVGARVKQFNDIWSKFDNNDFVTCKSLLDNYISIEEDVDALCLLGKLSQKVI